MRLAPLFQQFLAPGSAGGPAVTREELEAAVRQASVAELKTFAEQALDAVADGELVRLVADRIGANAIPPPTNSLRDAAAARSWLEGNLDLRASDRAPRNLEAIRTMQRALVKIGVHHPEGKRIIDLLQLPYGADGSIGDSTIKALNAAMVLAGRPDLAHLDRGTVIGKSVAEALEGLLQRSTRIVHPVFINVPPPADQRRVVLFVGMGDHARHEADAVKRALPPGMEMTYVGDSILGDDKIKVAVGANQVVFDLTTPNGRNNFVDQAFRPPLTRDQREKVLAALDVQAWGIADSRDEVALMALEFHRCESSNGRRKLSYFYASGHSAGGGVWGDHNGELQMESLRAICEAFPNTAADAPYFAACNHLHPSNVEEFMEMFPGMKHAGGYSAYAPGTWVGGIAQCLAWIHLLNAGNEIITPEMMIAKLRELKETARGDRNNPLFYALEKSYHIATWNAADGKYRYFEKIGENQWAPRVADMRPDPAQIQQRLRAVRELEGQMQQMLQGTNPNAELRDVVPHGDNLACRFYENAVKLAGTMGLAPADADYAKKWKALGLRARYYAQILDKFTEAFKPQIDGANAQLAAINYRGKTADDLKSPDLKRKPMLDYIAQLGAKVGELRAANKPFDKVEALHREMAMRIRDLDNIPATWL